MNCAESQDLLIDLAYGELEPARAAEVKEHVAGCAACRAEQAQLEQARMLSAQLRELEEPSANFDEPILRAARAEAGMQADGTPGPVVEVAASVKPLGLQAARLDPHAKVRGGAGHIPWWRRRVAVLGSVAAAAAVIVIAVSVSLTGQGRRNEQVEVTPITVRAPDAVVPESVKDALARNDTREAPPAAPPTSNSLAGSRAVVAAPPERKAAPEQDAAAPKLAKRSRRNGQTAPETGVAGGLMGGTMAAAPADGKAKVAQAERADEEVHSEAVVRSAPAVATPAAARPDADRVASQTTPVSGSDVGSVSQSPVRGAAASVVAKNEAVPETTKQEPVQSADVFEDAASVARRVGDYATAAGLYRQAAALRKESAPQQAAWDLAHAVECLAAGGNVSEAIAVRKELLRSFPDQQGPRAAANSALRSVPLPSDEDAPQRK